MCNDNYSTKDSKKVHQQYARFKHGAIKPSSMAGNQSPRKFLELLTMKSIPECSRVVPDHLKLPAEAKLATTCDYMTALELRLLEPYEIELTSTV